VPTYEYVCEKCGHHFEKVQPISAKALTVCPEELCAQKRWGRGKVKRAINVGGGLIFKGSGFYVTDYRSEKYKEAAKKDSSSASSSGSGTSSAGSGEAKTASKAAESKPAKPPAAKS
jgi:putative FmdB family regulatory protein